MDIDFGLRFLLLLNPVVVGVGFHIQFDQLLQSLDFFLNGSLLRNFFLLGISWLNFSFAHAFFNISYLIELLVEITQNPALCGDEKVLSCAEIKLQSAFLFVLGVGSFGAHLF